MATQTAPVRSTASRLAWLTAVASFTYALAGLYWMAGGRGFPFGVENDPLAYHQSLLESVTRSSAARWVFGLGLAGAACAVILTRRRTMGGTGVLLSAFAWTQAVAYALVIPDGRPLVAVAHIPVLIVGKPFGWPPDVTISSQLSWPILNQILLMALGALWAATAVVFRRRTAGQCLVCGRGDVTVAWTLPCGAARWGRWAVIVAVIPPVVYATTRISWAFGVPFGVSEKFLTEQAADAPEIFVAGAAMAGLALGGAVLTTGLVFRWGEVFPRWIPGLRHRPVRPRTAIVPAVVVAFLMTSSGVGWVRAAVSGYFPDGAIGEDFGTVGPGALLPVWGVALGAAAYAYYLRRRPACKRCQRR
ncbi:NYN domain-containing protein [Kribbella sp. NPDC023855]|uniref:NYN domain-containing protein n=1 Tax=Kribbella sp. NPDC023855 TaxID=3154698 RepID=UPI0033FEFE76